MRVTFKYGVVDVVMEKPRRDAILTAAKKLFLHYGPQKTTIHEIAREANCAVGAVYLEFTSKEDILSSLSTAEYDSVLGAMTKAYRAKKDAPFSDLFQHVLAERTHAFFDAARAGGHTCEIFHCRVESVHLARKRFDSAEEELWGEIFAHGRNRSECHAEEGSHTARTLQSCLMSVSPPWLFDHEYATAVERARDIGALVLRGLCAPDAAKVKRAMRAASRRLSR